MGRTDENSLALLSKQYEKQIIDEASTTVTYIGYSEFGTATSAAKWIVKRITAASGTSPQGVIVTEYAVGYNNATNIWDNRAGLVFVS